MLKSNLPCQNRAGLLLLFTELLTFNDRTNRRSFCLFHFLQKNWTLRTDGCYHFANKDAKPKEPLPSLELAEQAIFYARELEMIV